MLFDIFNASAKNSARAARQLALAATLALTATVVLANASPSWAKPIAATTAAMQASPQKQPEVEATGLFTVGNAEDIEAIKALLKQVLTASNAHQIDALLSHYAPRFVSGDHLALKEVRSLIEETWKSYPNVSYTSKPLVIRVSGDWASVESLDTARAEIAATTETGGQSGELLSQSRGLLHLQRIGDKWTIVGDTTLYEAASIRYGSARDLNISLSAPEQVAEGAPYSAKLDAELKENTFAVATISKDPITYPQAQPEEKFRTISNDRQGLERVFEGNTAHRNELITATLGITSVSQDKDNRPQVALTGLATMVRRVNLIPQGQQIPKADEAPEKQLIKTSSDGKIDVTTQAPPADEAPEAVKPATTPAPAPKSSYLLAPHRTTAGLRAPVL
ncbi:MAG: hypothetical protein VKJ06_06530 [Vampirovibrionales bacterium]|nr:hypothetical protein [Vampirovibrionales bacterium]